MGEEIDMAYSDRELLARLIECEAGGEGENGMKAVASVVMNRVRSTGGEYARGAGQHPLNHLSAGAVRLREGDRARQLQPAEHLLHAPDRYPLRDRGLGHRGQPIERPWNGAVVL